MTTAAGVFQSPKASHGAGNPSKNLVKELSDTFLVGPTDLGTDVVTIPKIAWTSNLRESWEDDQQAHGERWHRRPPFLVISEKSGVKKESPPLMYGAGYLFYAEGKRVQWSHSGSVLYLLSVTPKNAPSPELLEWTVCRNAQVKTPTTALE